MFEIEVREEIQPGRWEWVSKWVGSGFVAAVSRLITEHGRVPSAVRMTWQR